MCTWNTHQNFPEAPAHVFSSGSGRLRCIGSGCGGGTRGRAKCYWDRAAFNCGGSSRAFLYIFTLRLRTDAWKRQHFTIKTEKFVIRNSQRGCDAMISPHSDVCNVNTLPSNVYKGKMAVHCCPVTPINLCCSRKKFYFTNYKYPAIVY